MTKTVRDSALTRTLLGVEWLTIIAGFVAASYVVVHDRREARAARRDLAAPVERAASACSGGSGALATLHAYLDGAELVAEPSGTEPTVDAALRARGAQLYAEHCATCHGMRGDGTGPTAAQLQHPPANFTLGIFELRTTEHEALPADIDLFRTITRGVHGTAMPPWFALPEHDRWALAAHVKTLSQAFADDEAPTPVDVSHPPAITPERAAHGAQLYATAGCASCHGAEARGDGPAAAGLSYKSGVPAHPRDLRAGRFHRGTRLADVYLTLVTGLDGTPMGSFAKVMSPDDLWDVAMYVSRLAPTATVLPDGTRCPEPTAESATTADELVGVRALLRTLAIH